MYHCPRRCHGWRIWIRLRGAIQEGAEGPEGVEGVEAPEGAEATGGQEGGKGKGAWEHSSRLPLRTSARSCVRVTVAVSVHCSSMTFIR